MPLRRLAAIMFTDIVGYTAMMQENQSLAEAAIKQHEAILHSKIEAHGGELLQTYGDGSLSIFDSASLAVQCAKEIQEALRGEVPLKIGLHIGEITKDEGRTFGDGVNVASRIESLGQAGTVLFSQEVNNKIKNRPEFETQSLGKFFFKNVAEPMEVFALANDGFPIPKRAQMRGKLDKQPGNPYIKWLIPAAIVVLAVLMLSPFFSANQENAQLNLADKMEARVRSIAVLPFRDLSQQGNKEYFSHGVSEELLNLLTKVEKLKVASRTSSFVFKEDNQNIQDIAGILGVDYVLEGSMRKSGDQLRVTAQLIDATTDRHIWSENFDRKWNEALDLQDELAEAIVKEVNKLLGNDSSEDIKLELSTTSLDAYDLFLKANNLPGSLSAAKLERMIDLGERAVALDPNYLDAWIFLSQTYMRLSTWKSSYGKIDPLLEKSRLANDTARKLAPDDVRVLSNRAMLKYAQYEMDSAVVLLEEVIKKDPGQISALTTLAETFLSLGYFKQAISTFELALEQEAHAESMYAFAGLANSAYGKFDKAEEYFTQARELGYPSELEYELVEIYRRKKRKNAIRLIATNLTTLNDSLSPLVPYASKVLSVEDSERREALENFRTVARGRGLEETFHKSANRYFITYFDLERPKMDISLPSTSLCWLWSPYLREYRQTEEFKNYIREANVLAYWQKHSFPPQCKQLENGDFVCE